MLRILLFAIPIFFSTLVIAQNTAITGQVVDESNLPIPYASVALYTLPDSTMVTGDATDVDGNFSIPVDPGRYYLLVSFLAYEVEAVTVTVQNEDVNLGELALTPSSMALEEVQVQAQRSSMQLQVDKRVFNVGEDLTMIGSNASDILDNIPSVAVDVEGNISLRGSENVRILIDGKPSGFTGITPAEALRQLQGSMIERIEIITNPSARYDAEGEVGIINIILKKERQQGLNGTFEATAGYPLNTSASASINFRKRVYNLFASYAVGYRESPGGGSSLQRFTLPDTSYSYTTDRERTRGGMYHNLRFGSDFFINSANTLTLSGIYKYSDGLNTSKITYSDFDEFGQLTRTVTRTDEETEVAHDMEFALSHVKTFPQEGRKWSTDFKYIVNDDTETSDLLEVSPDYGTPLLQRSYNREDEMNWLIQSDYIHPFTENKRFEAGLKATFRTINNDYLVEEEESGEWFVLPGYNNQMAFQENIYAAYAMFSNKWGKLGYQAGVRAEYSDIRTELKETNDVNDRSYLDFFPSVHTTYEFNSKKTLQASYSRRLSRPHFRWLLPFFAFSDSRNFFSGNPNLEPEYTNAFELGYLRYMDNMSILTSVYYRHTTGEVERITVVDSTGLTRQFPINLSDEHAFGVEANFNADIRPWWQFNTNFNFYRAITEGHYEGQDFHSDTYGWMTRANSRMRIAQKLDFQTSFNYRSPRETPQGRRRGVYSIDMGLGMDVLKRNGTLVLSVRDLLNSRKRMTITELPGYYSESEFQWRSRSVTLSFTYRLNQNTRNRQQGGNGGGGIDGEMEDF